MDDELELVRRGFDPGQVQQLVAQLSAELRTVAAENDRLRARIGELERAGTSVQPNDIFTHWSRETNDLMSAARASIASVTDKATADAAAAVAAGEMAANAIRQRAQLDADSLLAEARRHADQVAAVAAAEKAAREAEAQATVDRATAQVAALEAKLAGLRAQRATMSHQLGTAKSHLLQLMSLVDDQDEQVDTNAAASASAAAPYSPGATWLGVPPANEQH